MLQPLARIMILAAVTASAAAPARGAADDSLAVLDQPGQPLVYRHLLEAVDRQLAERAKDVEQALASPEAVLGRREQLLANYREFIGPLPERSPLNARTVGTLQCDGYRIEKVIYESRPNHHVTASLYLPDNVSGTLPGVLVPCGHSDQAKAYPAYQSACVLLALHGCVALIYDPIGQGERNQLPDTVRHSTTEHTLVGLGALLVGLNTAHFRIWDGLRSMDYLASRPEVDPQRLGCTGNSGGGTMTTWLMAADPRIVAAAPACFITTVERLFKTIGPQDCEQHFPGQGALGIDHTDFITMRAPQPTLILAAEKDYFDFGGTREAYRQAAELYRVLSRSEQVSLFSYPDEHGFSQPRREAAVQWMRRWLADDDRPVHEPTLTLQKPADLQVTELGQVVGQFDDEVTVVDLVNQRARLLADCRQAAWEAMDRTARVAVIKRLLGLAATPEAGSTVQHRGTVDREQYTIEKLCIERLGDVPLPALLCLPAEIGQEDAPDRRPAVVYAHDQGKAVDLGPDGPIERLLATGNVVLAVDLRGYGETADVEDGGKYHNDEFRTAMVAMHIGRPLLGQRVADLLTVLAVLADHPAVDPQTIGLVGVGRAGPVALHAAVVEPRFASVVVRASIRSWTDDVVAQPLAPQMMGHVVPGVLEHYDLPDLAAMLGERLTVEPAATEPAK